MTKIERKRHGPRRAQTAWFYQYLAKGLHKEKNGKRTDCNTFHIFHRVEVFSFILYEGTFIFIEHVVYC